MWTTGNIVILLIAWGLFGAILVRNYRTAHRESRYSRARAARRLSRWNPQRR